MGRKEIRHAVGAAINDVSGIVDFDWLVTAGEVSDLPTVDYRALGGAPRDDGDEHGSKQMQFTRVIEVVIRSNVHDDLEDRADLVDKGLLGDDLVAAWLPDLRLDSEEVSKDAANEQMFSSTLTYSGLWIVDPEDSESTVVVSNAAHSSGANALRSAFDTSVSSRARLRARVAGDEKDQWKYSDFSALDTSHDITVSGLLPETAYKLYYMVVPKSGKMIVWTAFGGTYTTGEEGSGTPPDPNA